MSIRIFPSRIDQVLGAAIVCAGAVVSLWCVSPLWGHALVYADDLAGHVAIVQRVMQQLAAGNDPWFYDRWWFSGFGAFELYGLLGHVLTAPIAMLFSGDSWARSAASANASMVIAVGFLPIAVWLAARSILARCPLECSESLSAAFSVAAAITFLTVSEPGLPAGVGYAIGAGVFSQVLAWPLLLLYLALVVRFHGPGWKMLPAALGFVVLYAVHPLTGIAGLAAASILVLAFDGFRRMAANLVLALGLCAWLWLPMLLLAGDYGAGQPTWSERGGLSILADGWLDFFSSKTAEGSRMFLEAVLLLSAVGFVLHEGGARLSRALLLLILALWLTTGVELAESIAVGFHYARLQAVLSLVFLTVSGVAAAILSTRLVPALTRSVAAIVIAGVGIFVMTDQFDAFPMRSDADPEAYRTERSLLSVLQGLPAGSRVLFEYPVPEDDDWSQFPGKYVEARLAESAGLEIVNGLLTQSSRPYLLYATAMGKLGINMFSPAAPADRRFNLGLEGVAALLRRNSISHVVVARERSAASLARVPGMQRIDQVGRYRLFALDAPSLRIKATSVPLLGFVDVAGNLPFRFLDEYVEFDHRTSGNVRLVELGMADLARVEVDGLILNIEGAVTSAQWQAMRFGTVADVPTVTVAYEPVPLDSHAARTTRHERQRYEAVHDYLETIGLANALAGFRLEAKPENDGPGRPDLAWGDEGQQLRLSRVSAGRWYEIAYSYFPAWMSGQAAVRRGSAGHIFVWPQQGTVELHYRRWQMPPVRIGLGVSVLTLISLGIAAYRRKARSRVPGGGSQE